MRPLADILGKADAARRLISLFPGRSEVSVIQTYHRLNQQEGFIAKPMRGLSLQERIEAEEIAKSIEGSPVVIEEPVRAPAEVKPIQGAEAIWQKVHKALSGGSGKHSILDLADRFNVAPKTIKDSIERIEAERILVAQDGHYAWIGQPEPGGETKYEHKIDIESYTEARVIRFGVCGDQHMCSRYERLDVLNALYDIFESEGIDVVYSPGNFIDGEARFNKQDLHTHGMGNQFNYFAKNYPRKPGIVTEFIGGDDHEGWYVQREGVDLASQFRFSCDKYGRDDLKYLGYMEHDIVVPGPRGDTKIRLVHPGGGSSYAISYTMQKLVESLSSGEKPQIMIAGHYHKAEYIWYRGMHVLQSGTTQDQTPFMRKKRLAAHLGGWICEAHLADDGSVRRFKQEFIPFFDKAYHEKEWYYRQEAA